MTDLVRRLRDLICDGDLCVSECSCKLALKAAAELERFAARVAELEAEVARANVVEDMWRNEALKAQQMLVEARQK